jgi:hypothetical protein
LVFSRHHCRKDGKVGAAQGATRKELIKRLGGKMTNEEIEGVAI